MSGQPLQLVALAIINGIFFGNANSIPLESKNDSAPSARGALRPYIGSRWRASQGMTRGRQSSAVPFLPKEVTWVSPFNVRTPFGQRALATIGNATLNRDIESLQAWWFLFHDFSPVWAVPGFVVWNWGGYRQGQSIDIGIDILDCRGD